MKKWLKKLIIAFGLLALSGVLMILFKTFPDFFFPWYRSVSRTLMKGLSFVTGLFPYAVWDIAAVLLILAFIISVIVMIVKKKRFLNWLSTIVLIASAMGTFVICGWMLNHYGPAIDKDIGLEMPEKFDKQKLGEALLYYFDEAAAIAEEFPEELGEKADRETFLELGRLAGKSYEKLTGTYPVLDGSTAPVKGFLLYSEVLMYQGFTGEFMPLSGESSVAFSCAGVSLPFTMCHEAAHRLGYASEESCNFAAFLACEASDDVRFRFSGYYSAFVYLYNEIYGEDQNYLWKILDTRKGSGYDKVYEYCDVARKVYEPYDTPIADVGETVNDTYLKAFSEESGVRSYNEVVRDLTAWYLQKK
ncbi:MAG: DUF3810 domain-containing protein [Lachnospiraceae bacterium]|nr:DUF3810 domain-containing protein [Lachnospiraceae bacterium]